MARKYKPAYMIWCEWDMGYDWENTVYETPQLAWEDIHEIDWDYDINMSIEDVIEDGLISVYEVTIILEE